MTSRERVRCAIEFKRGDRLPFDFSGTEETFTKLRQHFGAGTNDEVLDALDCDMRWLLADYVGPKRVEDGVTFDEWGIGRKPVSHGAGAYDEIFCNPLANVRTVAEAEALDCWAQPDSWDYESINREIEKYDAVAERWLGIGYANPFQVCANMMGYGKFYMDLALNQELVLYVMNRTMDVWQEQTLRILDAAKPGRIDMIYLGDDFGSQKAMLISPDMFRTLVKPVWMRYIKAVKAKHDLPLYWHSCGSIHPIIEDFIEMGVNILNPVQPLAEGMDPEKLAPRFAGRICFHGGIDIQRLLPRGPVDAIKREVFRVAGALGKQGGYILTTAHAVQDDTPVEHVLAMYEAGKEFYNRM